MPQRLPDRLHPPVARQRPCLLLALLLLAAVGLSLFLGRYPHPYWMPPRLLREDALAARLFFRLRLPRVLAAVLTGSVLASAGLVMQMIFRNPLVSPGFLGVSQGAAFGAAFAILFLATSPLMVQASSALFALLGLLLSYRLARHLQYGGWALRLVLAGIAVSALFSSGVGLLKYLADPLKTLPEIVFWLLGGLWAVKWGTLAYVAAASLPALLLLYLMRWRLNLLSLDDETAFSLGAEPGRERAILLTAAVVATAAVVSVAGIISWVGLIVPHLARRVVGADAQRALPASMLIGGLFTLLCDDLARILLAGEIPLGILTSLFGALLFAVMLSRGLVRTKR